MSEEESAPIGNASANQLSGLLEKHGLATFLLLAGIYVAWTSFLSPAADRYMKLLDSVTESNAALSEVVKELKQGIVDIGEKNGEVMQGVDRRLQDVERISLEISRKLDDLKLAAPAPRPAGNFTIPNLEP